MKTYAPNESPKVEDVEIGKPIFWKYEMQWVIPTKVGRSEMVWRMREDGREVWDNLENYTYNPVIPEPPKRNTTFYLPLAEVKRLTFPHMVGISTARYCTSF